MSSSGGNWKDLIKATGTGDLQLMEYHLKNGVDPNFQHAEYFTSPVFESIRAGNLSALQLLLTYGGSLTATEVSSEATPLEIALQEGQHNIVDFLVTKLNPKDVRPYLKRIAIPLHVEDKEFSKSTLRALQTAFLKKGYHIFLVEGPEIIGDASRIVLELREETGNKKVELISNTDSFPRDIDSFLHFVTRKEPCDKKQQQLEQLDCRRLTIVFNDHGTDVVSSLLDLRSTTTTAIRLYNSWWDRFTSKWWIQTWVDTVLWMATDDEASRICGIVHPYNQNALNERMSGIL